MGFLGDQGQRWRNLDVPLLRPRGTYCRSLALAPDDPDMFYLAGGNDVDGDRGALFVSHDGGESWELVDIGANLKTTVFAVAIPANQPDHIFAPKSARSFAPPTVACVSNSTRCHPESVTSSPWV